MNPNRFAPEIEIEVKYQLIGKLVRCLRHSAYPQGEWSYRGLVQNVYISDTNDWLWIIINVTGSLEESIHTATTESIKDMIRMFYNEELVNKISAESFEIGVEPHLIYACKWPHVHSILSTFEVLDHERDLPTLLEN